MLNYEGTITIYNWEERKITWEERKPSQQLLDSLRAIVNDSMSVLGGKNYVGESGRVFSDKNCSPLCGLTDADIQTLCKDSAWMKKLSREDSYILGQESDGLLGEFSALCRALGENQENYIHVDLILQSVRMLASVGQEGKALIRELTALESAVRAIVLKGKLANRDWGRKQGGGFGSYDSDLQRGRGNTVF